MIDVSTPHIVSIHTGRIAPLGPDGVPSGFVKPVHDGPAVLTRAGIVGDEQADLSVHGGPDKAVYAYAVHHYAAWRAEFPGHEPLFGPGGMGENLAIDGMLEADLCVGDVHRIGSARLQVCQPRQPCFKLALRFDDKRLPKAMVRSGRSGWYYRVLETGTISPDDAVILESRPNPGFPFERLVDLVGRGKPSDTELRQMQNMPGLAVDWQLHARNLLQRGP
jgi:MOSC domain-containing protein YiiM